MFVGMNPAIRAVARMGLYYGAKVYAVWEVSQYSHSSTLFSLSLIECNWY